MISNSTLNERKQFAAEYIMQDEGFWGEYAGVIDEELLEDYFLLAEEKAESFAVDTKEIEDDEKAEEYIMTKINEYKKELKNVLDELL
jgi:hypothetical protein